MTRGTLILVAGPSGAGKDTILAGARERLDFDPRFAFPRRFITRTENAGGEDHVPVTPQEFGKLRAFEAFALSWEAHGLSYGIPASIEDSLKAGENVAINVSRSVVADAMARFEPAKFVLVTASPEILSARLASRGREAGADAQGRLTPLPASDEFPAPDLVIANEGTVESAISAFLAFLKSIG